MIGQILALDTDMKTLEVGDAVRFAMPGFFQTRKHVAEGKIIEIDVWGGISIQVNEAYPLYTSTGAIAATTDKIYFIHHVYDSSLRARIYHSPNEPEQSFIAKLQTAKLQTAKLLPSELEPTG
jgi:hypothetical protein